VPGKPEPSPSDSSEFESAAVPDDEVEAVLPIDVVETEPDAVEAQPDLVDIEPSAVENEPLMVESEPAVVAIPPCEEPTATESSVDQEPAFHEAAAEAATHAAPDVGPSSTPDAADSELWKEQAEAFARLAGEGLDAIERDAVVAAERNDFHNVWRQVRELGEGIRTAPSISGPDRIRLQRRLNSIVRGVRESQRALQRESQAVFDELSASLQLAEDSVAEASSIADLEEVRADLGLLRDRITGLPPTFPRGRRSQLWNRWQTVNRTNWSALVERWTANEEALGATLDEAERALEAGNLRGARDAVRALHAAMTETPVSQRGARSLRGRANAIWQRAAERGREQQAQYLNSLRGRMGRWRAAMERLEQRRAHLESQEEQLQRQADSAQTDIAHALAVGQLAEIRKMIEAVQRDSRALHQQIAEAEERLADRPDEVPTPSESTP
jgi:hypothetical protein